MAQAAHKHGKIVFEKKKGPKRISKDRANVGCKPSKRKCDGVSNFVEYEKIDTDDQKASDANNLIEETFPIDPAPDEENIDVNVLPTFYNSKFRKSKPTKKMTKVSKDFKGQQKISNFFSSTKADIKPKPNAPT